MSDHASTPRAVSPERFRDAMALLASGVTVVTSRHAGRAHGFTASSFTSVSLIPPLVLVCASRHLDALGAIGASGGFAVSVLAADQVALGVRFAGLEAGVTDRFAGIAVESSPGGHPWLVGALAQFDCRLWRSYDGGDHVIVVGEVTAIGTTAARAPLVYFDRGWRRVDGPPLVPSSEDAGSPCPGPAHAPVAELAALDPRLEAGEYVLVAGTPHGWPGGRPVAVVQAQGETTWLLAREDADRAGLPYAASFRRITLARPSALLAVGQLAAVTARLAAAGISVHVVSTLHHDHLFVPAERAEQALHALRDSQPEWHGTTAR